MASINSSTSATSSSSKRLTGFMSGLDTDELVKQMTTTTRTKIAKQQQKKQTALWRQEAYRDVTKKINAFQNKWLTYSAGKNNIMSSNFFKTSTITNTSSFVKVSGDANVAKNIQISDIKSLAQTASFTSKTNFSSQSITSGVIEENWSESLVNENAISIEYGGETYNISVAKDFAFSSSALTQEQKLNEIVDALNKSVLSNEKLAMKDASGTVTGGKISFGIDAGLLKIKNTSGDGTNIKLVGGSNTLMEGLGLKASLLAGTTITGEAMDVTKLYADKTLKDTLSGSSLSLTFNGITKTISFRATDINQYDSPSKLASYLNQEVGKAFGVGKVNVALDNGKLKMTTADANDIFTVASSDKKGVLGTISALRVSSGISTRATWNTSIKEMIASNQLGSNIQSVNGKFTININNTAIEFDESETMSSVLTKINNSDAGVRMTYSTTTDKISISAKDSGVQGKVNIADSGATNDLAKLMFGGAVTDADLTVKGQDALINISFDGGKTFTDVTRSGNSFSLDGVNFELLGKADGNVAENITFKAENNVDELVTKMTEFFKDYNEIVKLCSDSVSQKANRNYPPLTDEQRKDMSDEEIKNWEAKAKEGLLSNDATLNQFLINLRSGMGGIVEGSNTALSKIGISTTDWKENGQFHIKEDALRKALTENPEEITSLFTNLSSDDNIKKSGISNRLSKILNTMAGTFGGDGLLIQMAGKATDSANGQDRISLQVKQMNRTISDLKDRLKTEEDRYYKQFTQLETYLSKMNAQSSWLNPTSQG
ncbi:flagellar filament capping protein FliD [Paludicola sp. MB14-C6]|uniref:flagellar filament capping protein FliD n=1 Tax=Paludihabitans sp. MB14-C6 TaxID=3070656 RepID=UPI0027DD927E|nr:flagellar filament capping protein FliD [Paludicola sp. MB14-C6]WMJ24266.1 flagellar filament capping protein FliD [Paludicola sp. MB14-C6]